MNVVFIVTDRTKDTLVSVHLIELLFYSYRRLTACTLYLWHEHQLHFAESVGLSLFYCNPKQDAVVLTTNTTNIVFNFRNWSIDHTIESALHTIKLISESNLTTFLPSLAWQLTFNGLSKDIIFSSLPLRALSKSSSFLYSPV